MDDDQEEVTQQPNILMAAMEKFHQQQEEGLGSLGEQKQEEVKPDDKKQVPPEVKLPSREEEEEAEVDGLKADDIRTGKGLPISENAKQKFKKLEESRNRWKTKASDYEKKMQELDARIAEISAKTANVQEAEEFKKLQEENNELKKLQDTLFFEQSEEWKRVFEAPIAAASERINGIIGSVVKNLQPQKRAELTTLLNRANLLLGSRESEAEFDSIVDQITEEVITGTAGSKFSKAMQDVFNLTVERQIAKKDKDAAREKITLQQRQVRDNAKKSLEELMALQEAAFEKTPVGEALSKRFADKFSYKENKEIGKKQVTEAFDILIKTGVVTPELTDALHHASLKRVHDKEREFLVSGYTQIAELAERQQKKINELEARITELRGGVGKPPSKTESESKQQNKNTPFSIVDRLNEKLSAV